MKNPIKYFLGAMLTFVFMTSAPAAYANTTTEYNQKVADAQAKINDLQNQLDNAQNSLDSWMNSSNAQAEEINLAQTVATEAKDALDKAAVTYATNKSAYDSWYPQVQSAEQAVENAVNAVGVAADYVDETYSDYMTAQINADIAFQQMEAARSDYNNNLINVGGQGTVPGLTVDIYTGINRSGNPPSRSDIAYTKCKTITVSNINADWGGGSVFGCASEYVMVRYRGFITYPTTTRVFFQAPADDGFFMTINGQQIINDWSLKGCGANSTGTFSFVGGKSYPIDAWFYEWSGGACSTLNYAPVNGSWAVAPASFFTQNAVENWVKNPALLTILNNKTAAYVNAVAAEEDANDTYLDAEDNYDGKWLTYIALGGELSSKKQQLIQLENVMIDSENDWQLSSDDSAVAEAELRDLKAQYGTIFNAINNAAKQVDDLEAQLAQAKVDLANIPKPTAASQRKPKKVTPKPMADAAYVPRPTFAPLPK